MQIMPVLLPPERTAHFSVSRVTVVGPKTAHVVEGRTSAPRRSPVVIHRTWPCTRRSATVPSSWQRKVSQFLNCWKMKGAVVGICRGARDGLEALKGRHRRKSQPLQLSLDCHFVVKAQQEESMESAALIRQKWNRCFPEGEHIRNGFLAAALQTITLFFTRAVELFNRRRVLLVRSDEETEKATQAQSSASWAVSRRLVLAQTERRGLI